MKGSLAKNKIFIPMDERPRCSVEGCNEPAQHMGIYRKDGTPSFRDICTKHHNQNVAKRHGLKNIAEVMAKNAGFDSVSEWQDHKAQKKGFANHAAWQDHQAQKKGFQNYTDYQNSKHRYRKNRKMYCENVSGEGTWVDPDTGKHRKLKEIGCECTATIFHIAQLSVDHINGDHHDDRDENHQTLCHNCHKIKSLYSKDHWSNEKKQQHLESMQKLKIANKTKPQKSKKRSSAIKIVQVKKQKIAARRKKRR